MQLLEERLAQMERKLMGPGVPNYNNTSSNKISQHPHVSDEENQSLSSTSNRAHSPIHLYENPDFPRIHRFELFLHIWLVNDLLKRLCPW